MYIICMSLFANCMSHTSEGSQAQVQAIHRDLRDWRKGTLGRAETVGIDKSQRSAMS